MIETDPSVTRIGAALTRLYSEGLIPVSYASLTLNVYKLRYLSIEREGLAVVWAAEEFK